MPHILHINDNNLLVQCTAEDGGQVMQRSQGYAWLKGDAVLFDLNSDDSPIDHCRIDPQRVNTRYWQQCAQTAIAGNGAGMRHAADLIWKHLAELKIKAGLSELALVVPANYRDEHLQLLLGVAQANELTVSGLLSKPVLATQALALPHTSVMHIDVQLHQTVISNVQIKDAEIALHAVDTNPNLGIQSLQESLLHALQANFIRSDRFDPLHNADTEQQLFNQLPDIIATGVNGEKAVVGVQNQGKLYSATIESNEIRQAFEGLAELIEQCNGQHIIVDTNAAFDLSQLDYLSGPSVSWASEPRAISKETASTKDAHGKVIYQTRLASAVAPAAVQSMGQQAPPPKPEPTPEQAAANNTPQGIANQATHLMQMGIAVPLTHAKLSLSGARLSLERSANCSDVKAMLRNGELNIINDEQRHSLQANDRLMSPFADGVITALRVL